MTSNYTQPIANKVKGKYIYTYVYVHIYIHFFSDLEGL